MLHLYFIRQILKTVKSSTAPHLSSARAAWWATVIIFRKKKTLLSPAVRARAFDFLILFVCRCLLQRLTIVNTVTKLLWGEICFGDQIHMHSIFTFYNDQSWILIWIKKIISFLSWSVQILSNPLRIALWKVD